MGAAGEPAGIGGMDSQVRVRAVCLAAGTDCGGLRWVWRLSAGYHVYRRARALVVLAPADMCGDLVLGDRHACPRLEFDQEARFRQCIVVRDGRVLGGVWHLDGLVLARGELLVHSASGRRMCLPADCHMARLSLGAGQPGFPAGGVCALAAACRGLVDALGFNPSFAHTIPLALIGLLIAPTITAETRIFRFLLLVLSLTLVACNRDGGSNLFREMAAAGLGHIYTR